MKIQWKSRSAVPCPHAGVSRHRSNHRSPGANDVVAAEREAALKSLQATHDAFLKSIAGLSEKQWRFKPAPDRWSVAEVSEHIAVSESTIFGLVQKQIMTSPADAGANEPRLQGKTRRF